MLNPETGELSTVDENAYASMNMWGLTPEFLELLEPGFRRFLSDLDEEDNKTEYLLPVIMDGLIQQGQARVKLLPTQDQWFGVTYKEDKQAVADSFKKLIGSGVYRSPLFDSERDETHD